MFIFNLFWIEANNTLFAIFFNSSSVTSSNYLFCKVIVKFSLTFNERQGFCLYILLDYSWQINLKILHFNVVYCSPYKTHLISSDPWSDLYAVQWNESTDHAFGCQGNAKLP